MHVIRPSRHPHNELRNNQPVTAEAGKRGLITAFPDHACEKKRKIEHLSSTHQPLEVREP